MADSTLFCDFADQLRPVNGGVAVPNSESDSSSSDSDVPQPRKRQQPAAKAKGKPAAKGTKRKKPEDRSVPSLSNKKVRHAPKDERVEQRGMLDPMTGMDPNESFREPVLTESYMRVRDATFAPKTLRQMNELAFDGLEFNNWNVPILDPMDFSRIPVDATIVNFGKRRLGKSFLTRWLLYMLGSVFPRGLVFSATEALNRFYEDFIPQRFIIHGFNERILQMFLDLQFKLVTIWKEAEKAGEDLGLPENWERAFVIFDDVISDEYMIRFSKGLQTITIAGRHYHVLSLFNTQYSFVLTPSMKKNTDIAIMFMTTDGRDREAMFMTFGSLMQDEALFYRTLDFYSRDNMVLIGDFSDSKEVSIKKVYKWAKASEVPPFRIGNRAYWEGNDSHFANGYTETQASLQQRDVDKVPDVQEVQINALLDTESDSDWDSN